MRRKKIFNETDLPFIILESPEKIILAAIEKMKLIYPTLLCDETQLGRSLCDKWLIRLAKEKKILDYGIQTIRKNKMIKKVHVYGVQK